MRDTITHINDWLLITDYNINFIDERIKNIHKNIIEKYPKYMHFIQFCFIGAFFLIPEKFHFQNISDKNKIIFSKHWGIVMSKLGFIDNNFINGDLKAIINDMKKQKNILASSKNIDEKLFFSSVNSFSSIFSTEYSKSMLCYYHDAMDLPEIACIDYIIVRIFVVNITLKIIINA